MARQTGDVEAVIAVKKRDLSLPYSYLQIAETYKQAGQHDLALDWAERGLKAFPKRPDARLRKFLAAEYHRRKRHDAAMALVWAEFTDRPDLEQYRNLKNHADRVDQWPSWREKAVLRIRDDIAAAKRAAGRNRWSFAARTDHSPLVRVFLWEKKFETAWNERERAAPRSIIAGMTKPVIRVSEADAATDFRSLMAHVRAGVEVIIESGTRAVAVLHAAEPVRRTLSECIELAKAHEKETGKAPVLDADFAEDVEDILEKRKPWNPPAWPE